MIIGHRDFDFSGRDDRVYVMGILNVTPDSFSDGGRFLDPQAALDHALKMQEEGADLIDVGAESTRPGSLPVSAGEENDRLVPVLRAIAPKIRIPLSVDTQKPEVAETAIGEGAAMVNDVSALEVPGMAEVVAKHRVPVVLMHKKGEPRTMQENPSYEKVLEEIETYLAGRIAFAVGRGIDPGKILVDPGLGFGKRFEDNLLILRLLAEFRALRAPIVIGASRKSFVRKIFGQDEKDVLAGSVAAAVLAATRGASVLRVHDVAATRAAIRLAVGDAIS